MECPLCGSELPTTYGDGWRDGDEVNCTDPECRAQWFMSVDEDGEAWVQDQDEEPEAAPPDTKATTQGAGLCPECRKPLPCPDGCDWGGRGEGVLP